VTRLSRIADGERIFFVTTNLRRHSVPLTGSERDLLLKQIQRQRAADEFLVFGYVIMPSHVHLLFTPNRVGLIAIMREFKSCAAQQLTMGRRSHGAIWQPRYFDFVLRRGGDFWDKLAYIHQNPLEAGLVQEADRWPWSSAPHYLHGEAVPVSKIPSTCPRIAKLGSACSPGRGAFQPALGF
jgi:putative transposase